MTRRIVALFLAGALLAAGSVSGDDKAAAQKGKESAEKCSDCVLKVGAVASSPKSVTVFRSMRFYFAKNKMPIEFVLYSTYDLLGEALEKGHVDVAWNSPLGHAKFHLKAGGSTAVVMGDVDVNYKIKLIVRKDAGISTVKDLADKTMIFGSCDSADATVLPVYLLKKEGVNFEKVKIVSLHNEVDEMGVPCHSQHHVLAALLKGRGQAGILSSALWNRLQKEQPEEAAKFKEIWTSPGFSHCVFTARKDFCKDTCERFTKLMLAMDGKDAVTCEILKLEHCTKWVPAGQKAQDGFATLLTALREQPSVASLLLK